MEKDFWLGRWTRGETGWHQDEVESSLITHFSGLLPTRVFVPLCGKSLDLKWLASKGHEVIGVELSEKGCRAFFEENQLEYKESRGGGFLVFVAGAITIYCGDFFDLSPSHLGKIGAIYDRAALIALPPELRPRYARHLVELVRETALPGLRFLQVVLRRTPHDEKGPPFSILDTEIRQLYGHAFKIEQLSCEAVDMNNGSTSVTEEYVYRFV